MMKWIPLENEKQLEEIDEISKTQRVLIYKHSTRCSISAMSLERLNRDWSDDHHHSIVPYYLDLLQYRNISNRIVEKYGVEHESPQVLIIENGKAIYHASHSMIRAEELLMR